MRFNLPSRLSLNIAANLASNLLTAVVFIVSVPLILPYIGVEAYGLVGFYVSLQALMSVLDLGLNVTITREFAIGIQDQSRTQEIWDLLRTSEVFYWGLAIVTVVCWIGGTHFLTGFLNPEGLSEKTIEQSLVLMGLSLALQFPTSLYSSGLFGMQKQALVSGIKTSFSAARNLGVIGVLHYASPTPEAFFIWHAICNAVIVPIFAVALRRSLPVRSGSARIRPELITSKWRFVTGIGIITLTATLLANVDRLVVARMLSLETFGFYTLASTISNGIHWLVQPVFTALFPRLSQLATQSDRSLLVRTYHQGCQLMALVVLPVGITIALFSKEVVWVWQQNQDTVRDTYLLVSILIAATTTNALNFIPYALQLAFASTRLQVIAIAIGLIVTIPGSIAMVSVWGPAGAAVVWLLLNLAMLVTVVPISHSLLLPGETRFWAIRDVILPAVSAFVVAGAARILFQPSSSRLLVTLQLAAAYGFTLLACLAGSNLLRSWVMRRFRKTNAGLA